MRSSKIQSRDEHQQHTRQSANNASFPPFPTQRSVHVLCAPDVLALRPGSSITRAGSLHRHDVRGSKRYIPDHEACLHGLGAARPVNPSRVPTRSGPHPAPARTSVHVHVHVHVHAHVHAHVISQPCRPMIVPPPDFRAPHLLPDFRTIRSPSAAVRS